MSKKLNFMAVILDFWRPSWIEKMPILVFQILKTLSFPKMYSFHFLQKIPTKKHKEPDYIVHILVDKL